MLCRKRRRLPWASSISSSWARHSSRVTSSSYPLPVRANSVAVGNGASSSAGNSVALGAGSVASVGAQSGYTGAYGQTGASNSAGEVSVGSSGSERKITHVADGSDDHDATNVGQLKNGVNYAIDQSKSYTDQKIQNITNVAGSFRANNTNNLADPSASGANSAAGGAGSTAAGANSTALGLSATFLRRHANRRSSRRSGMSGRRDDNRSGSSLVWAVMSANRGRSE